MCRGLVENSTSNTHTGPLLSCGKYCDVAADWLGLGKEHSFVTAVNGLQRKGKINHLKQGSPKKNL